MEFTGRLLQGELDAARKAWSGFREEQGHDHLEGLPFHAMVRRPR